MVLKPLLRLISFLRSVLSLHAHPLLSASCQSTPQGHEWFFLLKLGLMKYRLLQLFLRERERFVKIEETKMHHGEIEQLARWEGEKMEHLGEQSRSQQPA